MVHDHRHPARERAPGTGIPVLLVRLWPAPEVNMHVDRARHDHEPRTVESLVGRAGIAGNVPVHDPEVDDPPSRQTDVLEYQV